MGKNISLRAWLPDTRQRNVRMSPLDLSRRRRPRPASQPEHHHPGEGLLSREYQAHHLDGDRVALLEAQADQSLIQVDLRARIVGVADHMFLPWHRKLSFVP